MTDRDYEIYLLALKIGVAAAARKLGMTHQAAGRAVRRCEDQGLPRVSRTNRGRRRKEGSTRKAPPQFVPSDEVVLSKVEQRQAWDSYRVRFDVRDTYDELVNRRVGITGRRLC